jgi:hypothetical protein
LEGLTIGSGLGLIRTEGAVCTSTILMSLPFTIAVNTVSVLVSLFSETILISLVFVPLDSMILVDEVTST